MNDVFNAIIFLVFSYFKIDLSEYEKDKNKFDDDVLNQAIDLAYKDATNQGAFNTIKKQGNPSEKKNEAAKLLRKCMSNLFGFSLDDEEFECKMFCKESCEQFDKWHENICCRVVNIFKDVKACEDGEMCFTYGNAQKWINMTLKNLYVISGALSVIKDKEKFRDPYKKILETSECFHVPIDSYILDATWYIFSEDQRRYLPEKDNIKRKNSSKYKKPSFYIKPWSKWSCVEYKNYKNTITECLKKQRLIDWECKTWISKAKP